MLRLWTPETEALAIEAARQDPSEFGVLYARYRDRVYRYLLTRAATTEEAEDLLQLVFLRAMSSLSQYRPEVRPFIAWLLGIARNLSIDHQRRARSTVQWDLVPGIFRTSSSDVEADVLRQEELADLSALFRGLPPDKRELLVLRFAAGLTIREIAGVVGKSEAATKKQISRTLNMLKEQYYDSAH